MAKSLTKHGFNAAPLHGDLDQSVRTRTLEGFRSGEILLLVASDVAARGLDIPAVSHIFNFDAPFHADDYVHRIGRTGRAGRSGHAFMLATPRDAKYVEAIEKLIGNALPRRRIDNLEVREEREQSRDRTHGERRPRNPRGRQRDHAPRETRDVSTHAATEPAARTPRKTEEKRGKTRNTKAAEPAPAHRPAHAEDASRDAAQLPAFLLRPVKLPKAEAKTVKDEAEPAEA